MRGLAIWGFAFGYFACYVPYSALHKAITKGRLPEIGGAVEGFALLPLSVAASVVGMFGFITLMGWWQYAPRRRLAGLRVPFPTIWIFLSGLCTATIIMTTTLAYTFDGVSIVFVMLLMRGGVLILAPIVDAVTGRSVRWFSWSGLVLSLMALVVAFSETGGYDITLICAIDVAAYLTAYFIRLRFMSRLAKTDDAAATKSYFVQEQMTAAPALLLMLGVLALIGQGEILSALRAGFTEIPFGPAAPYVILIGLLSQGTGIFGSLIFLDKRETTYCVPVNRSSSILVGVLARYSLHWFGGLEPPSAYELTGAALIIGAILFLTLPPALEKRRARALA